MANRRLSRVRRGWHGDSWRHSLAARGYKVGRRLPIVGKFKSFDALILAHLQAARRPMTSSELAGRSGISWETAKKELLILESQGRVQKVQYGERVYWRLV